MNCNIFFLKHVKFKVHAGKITRFWEDSRLYDRPIKDCYPHLFNVSRSKNLKVAEVGFPGENGVVWNLKTPTRLYGEAAVEHAVLLTNLRSFNFSIGLEDDLQWSLSSTKNYTVKSLYDFMCTIDSNDQESAVFSFIWKQKYPPKIRFFLWTIAHDRLPTGDSLRKKVWSCFLDKLNWFFSMPEHTATAIQSWHLTQSSSALTDVWNLIPATILWCIWQERNARVFNRKISNEVAIINKAIYCLYSWSLAIKDFELIYSADVMNNWHSTFFG
ncbi:uncharacterized protein LOC113279971 [Papaver somniferum]|uniref:uncharacterized protein LOC113279971 n=1 Tax=Papaver somniferum TaxID=3469 RepID=UPI000E703BED|nr:uncharacterized protein LOC113279971 [Papaver somniferum]